METRVRSAICQGLATSLITIETVTSRGFGGLQLLGNTAEICRDGKERARAALEQAGIVLPAQRLVINIAPADIRKDGNQFDLPLAVSLALASTERPAHVDLGAWLFAGELGLSGEIRSVRGIVPFALAATEAGLKGIVMASANVRELAALGNYLAEKSLIVAAFDHLQEVLAWLWGEREVTIPTQAVAPDKSSALPDFDDMTLTPDQCLLAETVAAGEHSLLLHGTPGTGKTMFATRLASLFPRMDEESHRDALRVRSILSETLEEPLLRGHPPYRSPHHGASAAALLGHAEGPGELSLAHGGILFLDELPEFRRDLVEALREPIETGVVRLSRAREKIEWPARVVLIAAMNSCPCGWYGSSKRTCHCSSGLVQKYQAKMSGPFLDRIDLHAAMPEPEESAAMLTPTFLARGRTQTMRQRVALARQFAMMRNLSHGVRCNANLPAKVLREVTRFQDEWMKESQATLLSTRSLSRTLRVARTLADLDESESVEERHWRRALGWQRQATERLLGKWGNYQGDRPFGDPRGPRTEPYEPYCRVRPHSD